MPSPIQNKADRDKAMLLALINGARREAVAARYGVSLSTLERRVGVKLRAYRERTQDKPMPLQLDLA